MRKIYLALVTCTALAIGFIVGQTMQDREINTRYFQQNIDLSEIKDRADTPIPEWNSRATYPLYHLDKSTTSLRMIDFATDTNVVAFYGRSDGSLNFGILNYATIKRYGEAEKQVPIIEMCNMVHEIVHMTTLYNGPQDDKFINPEIQEKMAYDAGNICEQIVSLDEDGWIKIIKQ